MPTYVLGPREFRSKTAARDEIRRVLNDAHPGVPLHGDDLALIVDLLRFGRHPEAAEKIGSGIAAIEARPSSHGQRCFWVRRTDGSSVDFSYLVALNGQPSPKGNVVPALREEITDQIQTFRDKWGGEPCELCGLPIISAIETGHVDHHDPTFDELATQFAGAVGGWEKIEIECVGPTGRQLRDRELAQVWRAFHLHTAQLRLTHSTCNLGRKRGDA